MALSGSIYGSIVSNHYRIRIDWSATQSIANNQSYVRADMYLEQDSSWSLNVSARAGTTITFEGQTYSGTAPAINKTGGTTLLISSSTYTIDHNSDGTRGITISGYYPVRATISGTYYEAISASQYVTLDSIPRASDLTSGTNFNIGDNVQINIAQYSSSFTTEYIIIPDNLGYEICRSPRFSGSSYNWAMTQAHKNSLWANIPNSNSIGYTVILRTYYDGGNSNYGDKSYRGTMYVVNSNPTFSNFSYADINATVVNVTGNNQKIVASQSNLRVTCNTATGINYATIVKYRAVINGKTIESTTTTIDVGTIDTNDNLIVTAIDSRGNITSVTRAIIVVPYESVKLTSITLKRKNDVETETTLIASGTYNNLTIDGIIKNSIQIVKYRYKLSTASTFGNWITITTTNGTNTFSYNSIIGNFNIDSSYNFELYVEDKLTNYTISGILVTGRPLVSYRKDMVGFGKVPEANKGLVQVNGDAQINSGFANFTGMILPWVYTYATIPEGWIRLEGGAFSRTTYSKLFSLIGTQFGAGDGSTTFNVPDFRGRTPVGYNSTDSNFNNVGKVGGASSHTLSWNEMPTHSHGVQWVGNHQHSVCMQPYSFNDRGISGIDSIRPGESSTCALKWEVVTGSGSHNHGMDNSGSGWAHNNLQPYISFVWIIKY